MKKTVLRGIAATALVVAAGLAAPIPALADTTSNDGGVVVVDEPDTSGLNNKWTLDPLGVPILGVIDSALGVPGKLGLPALPSLPF